MLIELELLLLSLPTRQSRLGTPDQARRWGDHRAGLRRGTRYCGRCLAAVSKDGAIASLVEGPPPWTALTVGMASVLLV